MVRSAVHAAGKYLESRSCILVKNAVELWFLMLEVLKAQNGVSPAGCDSFCRKVLGANWSNCFWNDLWHISKKRNNHVKADSIYMRHTYPAILKSWLVPETSRVAFY